MQKKRIEDHLALLDTAENAEQSFRALTAIMADYGFDKVTYTFVTDHPSLGLERLHGFAHTFPEDWMKHYQENDLMNVDPVPKQHFKSAMPFYWSKLLVPEITPEESIELMENAADAGLNDGAVVPLHSAGGEIASVAAARSDKCGDNSYEDLAALQMISTYFHESYKQRIKKTETVRLSSKETEILVWASEGKVDVDIADIMNISAATVRYHWKNIFNKLDAYGRVYAITKAIRLQLIHPYTVAQNYHK